MNGGFAFAMLTFAMSSYVVGNAYIQKQQFYPTVVHLTKSNSYMAVLYVQAFVLVLVMFKSFRWIFFGQLRLEETEHLVERLWYAIPDTCLAFTFFSQDFSPQFVAMFTILFLIKAFHWLAEDRIDYMDRSPSVNWLFHLRALGMVALLAVIDTVISLKSLSSVLNQGPSVQVVFSFEYAILLTMVCTIFVKYVLHSIDLAFDHPWENKPVYLLWSDLCLEFIRVILYYTLIYFFLMKVHTPPLFAFRPSYQSLMRMYKCIRDIIQSRRAILNLNALPDATAEQLANQDNVCIVCRDEMQPNATCKVLPCSHIFHVACLRRWFQRQQTCPTCRTSGLTNAAPGGARGAAAAPARGAAAAAAAAPAAAAPAAGAQQFQPGQQPHPGFNMMPGGVPPFPMWPPPGMFPPPVPPPVAPAADGTAPAAQGASSSAEAAAQPAAGFPVPPPGFSPVPPPGFSPGLPIPPFFPPPPPFMLGGMNQLPPDLSQLSDEQIKQLEGDERKAAEARIEVLRNIQKLLDAAVQQMEIYYSTASSPPAPSFRAAAAASSFKAPATSTRQQDQGNTTTPSVETLHPGQAQGQAAQAGSEDTPAEIRQRRLDWLRSTSQLSDDAGASGANTQSSDVSPSGDRRKASTEDDVD
ncbi:E3 ubiquitin-protein ligase synoviolin B-like isoform X2 [Sycon ciliatum]|uniref:E3 ubiquitin-protein ligase synoviolin B-like isoform X2 n=1 Tax=Sycon ciliatum TaxID=27933 RepID=UPI0031F6DAA7